MDNSTANSTQAKAHIDVCAEVNKRIIQQLENGCVPWRKPWTAAGVPTNIYSEKRYHGINAMLLTMAGYDENLFITFKQLKEIGGKVKQGEKGQLVCYWAKKEGVGNDASRQDRKPKSFLRHYYVFNVSQCENIPEEYLKAGMNREMLSCEAIVKGMPNCPKITHKEQDPFYDIESDCINMPKKNKFANDAAYYSTLFHELIHSTGNSARLNRSSVAEHAGVQDAGYSLEELVAEIGSCYLQSLTGIVGEFEQSAAYIDSWLKQLKNDKWFIFKASREAQKAVEYILNNQEEQVGQYT